MKKKNKFLWTIAFSSLIFGFTGFLTSCQGKEEPSDVVNPGDDDGDDKDETPVITKSLEIASQPAKTVFRVNEFFTLNGLIVQKVEKTDGVETFRETVDTSDYNLSLATGTQLTEPTDDLTVTLSLYSDPEYGSITLHFTVLDLDRVSVTFEDGEGNVLETDSVVEGHTTTYDGETPSKTSDENYSYRFVGWILKDDENHEVIDLSTYVFNEDTVLVPLFVQYDLQGSDGVFRYAVNGDSTGYIITEFYETNTITGDENTVVVIPDTFNNLPVVGIGDSVFSDCDDITSITLGVNVKSVGQKAFEKMGNTDLVITLNEGLETLSVSAFDSNKGIKSITIPGSVKEIPEKCFNSASNLTEINISEGVESIGTRAFNGAKVTTLTLPNSVKNITEESFYGLSNLETLNIGSGLSGENIGVSYLFELSTSALSKINVSEENPYLMSDGSSLYSKDGKTLYGVARMSGERDAEGNLLDTVYEINNTVETVGANAFNYFTKGGWTEIRLGENVKSVGDDCFRNNAGKVELVFNDKLEVIGNTAFYSFYNASYKGNSDLVLPDSVTTIGDQAFYGCSALTSITFGKNMRDFGYNIFSGCSKLKTYNLSPDSTYIKTIGNIVVDKDETSVKYYLDNDTEETGDGYTTFTMPSTVTTVERGAFYNNKKLTSVTFSPNLEKIEDTAFRGMTNLSGEINLPSTLTYVGAQAFYGDTKVTKVNYPGTITYLGDECFYNMSSAEFSGNLVIPEGATLGIKVFASCKSLTEMSVNTKLAEQLFNGCTELTTVTIRQDETEIPESCFKNCESLTSIVLPSTITAIRDDAFAGTKALNHVDLYEGLLSIGENAFDGSGLTSVTIPSTVTELGSYAFNGCTNLIEAVFTGSLSSLPSYLFTGTESLKSITWPKDLTTIGDSCFNGSALETVVVPEGVQTFGSNCFAYNTSLKTITLPNSLTDLGTSTFLDCTSLTTVNFGTGLTSLRGSNFAGCTSLVLNQVPAGIESLGYQVFSESGITEFTLNNGVNFASNGNGMFMDCEKLEKFTWNNTSMKEINSQTFQGCSSLKEFNVGEGVNIEAINGSAFRYSGLTSEPFDVTNVKEFGTYAFSGCENLTSFTLPTNSEFTTISDYCFMGDAALTEIKIPANVTSIGRYAFQDDTSLKTLTIENPLLTLSSNVSSASSAPFRNCSSLETVNFKGTITQAQQVLTNKFFGSGKGFSVTIVCTDGSYTYTNN